MSENLRRAQLLADHAWKMITSPGYNDTVDIRPSMSDGTRQQFEAVVELAGTYAQLATVDATAEAGRAMVELGEEREI